MTDEKCMRAIRSIIAVCDGLDEQQVADRLDQPRSRQNGAATATPTNAASSTEIDPAGHQEYLAQRRRSRDELAEMGLMGADLSGERPA